MQPADNRKRSQGRRYGRSTWLWTFYGLWLSSEVLTGSVPSVNSNQATQGTSTKKLGERQTEKLAKLIIGRDRPISGGSVSTGSSDQFFGSSPTIQHYVLDRHKFTRRSCAGPCLPNIYLLTSFYLNYKCLKIISNADFARERSSGIIHVIIRRTSAYKMRKNKMFHICKSSNFSDFQR